MKNLFYFLVLLSMALGSVAQMPIPNMGWVMGKREIGNGNGNGHQLVKRWLGSISGVKRWNYGSYGK